MLHQLLFSLIFVFGNNPGKPLENSKTAKVEKVDSSSSSETSASPTLNKKKTKKINLPTPFTKRAKKRSKSTRSLPAKRSWYKDYKLGAGIEFRGNYIPKQVMNIFLESGYNVAGPSYSLRFLLRTKKLDLILKSSYWNLNPPDGVYLGNGNSWQVADYARFNEVKLYWIQISFIWRYEIIEKLFLNYGGGVGGGLLQGSLYTTPAQGCTSSNYNNVRPVGGKYAGSSYCYVDNYKEFWEKQTLPKGMGFIEGTIGLRYDFNKNLSLNFETGLFFPGALHVSLSLDYIF